MKKWCVLLAVLTVTTSVIVKADAYPGTKKDEANIMVQASSTDQWFDKWGFKMSRGLINCASCWVELPRSIYIETAENPFIGPLKGTFKGDRKSVV